MVKRKFLQRKIATGLKLKSMEYFQKVPMINKKFTKNEWVRTYKKKIKRKKVYGNGGFI